MGRTRPPVLQRQLDLEYGYTELGGRWPSPEAPKLLAGFAAFLEAHKELVNASLEASAALKADVAKLTVWKKAKEATKVSHQKAARLALIAETEAKMSELKALSDRVSDEQIARAKALADQEAAAKAAARKALIEKKLKEHAAKVAAQTSEYDANPPASSVLYAAPAKFKIAGHGHQSITAETYGEYAKEKTDGGVRGHYMSGLTLHETAYKDRMTVEHAEESVPDHKGHSGGYFESKYSDAARAAFDATKDYGGADTTGKGDEQVFHPGKHNPYQTDFNLKHRLTDAVPADSPTGAYTSISSKFLSDAISTEALNAAKAAAKAELAANPSAYRTASGRFWKGYSVTLELGKPVGVGFEGTGGAVAPITDLFGNSSAQEGASRFIENLTHRPECAMAAGKAAQRGMESGLDRQAVKLRIKAAVNGVARAPLITDGQALNAAKAAEGAKRFPEPNIAPVGSAAITGTQTGLTLVSIDPSGANAVFAEGAGQHYPAKTPPQPLLIRRFGQGEV